MTPSRTTPAAGSGKEADAFVEKVLGLYSWTRTHVQTVVLGGVLVILVAAGLFYWIRSRDALARQALVQLEQVQQQTAFGDPATAEQALRDYLRRFDGTPYATEARIALGQLLLQNKTPDKAIEALSPAVASLAKDPLAIQAAFLLAAAYEEVGRLSDAEALLLKAAASATLPFQVREAKAAAARLRARRGDWTGAARLYEEILSSLPEGDPQRSYWQMRLAEATARG